ncbi:Fic family protein [Aliifodinibius halophilus]|uniref:Fic family protein n=2 Tax=Fodinibius halophilus TaxID=1736908 RepID=A0A6M1T0Y0_9BACT|nr:Fic family protein [Fodinibius halophilus]
MPQQPLYHTNPDRDVPWNGLPLLPINEELYKNVEIYEQLGRAKEAMGLLAGRSVAIPNQAILINSITLQEAKDSSAIENVFTTNDDLYQAFSDSRFDVNVSAPTKEVLRYREAIWKGHAYLQEHGAFDIDYFINLYREIKEARDGIRPPFATTYIRQAGSGPNAGKRIYTPPKGKEVLRKKLQNLVNFLNDDSIPPKEPLLKMAIAHFQFEAIHPFRDGNGRVGRILNIHYLTQAELLELPILYLSRYIIDHKQEYYDTLAGVSQRGDWESWILYILRAVDSTARLTYRKINEILEAKETILDAVEREQNFQRPGQLIDAIFVQPFTKVSHLTDADLYAENTARNYLNKLHEMGVVEKREIKGRHYYKNHELEQILSF